MKVLLIENKKSSIEDYRHLLPLNSQLVVAEDGESALELLVRSNYDLVVASVLVPKISNSRLIKELRKNTLSPIIAILPIYFVKDVVDCFKAGADEVVCKPWNDEEFAQRINAVIRRYDNKYFDSYNHENLSLDYRKKTLAINNTTIEITNKEYQVLEYLTRNKGIAISKLAIYDKIWGDNSDTIITIVEVYISKLRQIFSVNKCKNYIKTIKNVGYMWVD